MVDFTKLAGGVVTLKITDQEAIDRSHIGAFPAGAYFPSRQANCSLKLRGVLAAIAAGSMSGFISG
jgi:hypothetical protein